MAVLESKGNHSEKEVNLNPDGLDSSMAVICDLERKLLDLSDEKSMLQRKLDDAQSEIYIAGCVKESLFELERQNASRLKILNPFDN